MSRFFQIELAILGMVLWAIACAADGRTPRAPAPEPSWWQQGRSDCEARKGTVVLLGETFSLQCNWQGTSEVGAPLPCRYAVDASGRVQVPEPEPAACKRGAPSSYGGPPGLLPSPAPTPATALTWDGRYEGLLTASCTDPGLPGSGPRTTTTAERYTLVVRNNAVINPPSSSQPATIDASGRAQASSGTSQSQYTFEARFSRSSAGGVIIQATYRSEYGQVEKAGCSASFAFPQ